jgi:hypothetical protein
VRYRDGKLVDSLTSPHGAEAGKAQAEQREGGGLRNRRLHSIEIVDSSRTRRWTRRTTVLPLKAPTNLYRADVGKTCATAEFRRERRERDRNGTDHWRCQRVDGRIGRIRIDENLDVGKITRRRSDQAQSKSIRTGRREINGS